MCYNDFRTGGIPAAKIIVAGFLAICCCGPLSAAAQTVSVVASDDRAAEAGLDAGVITFSLSSPSDRTLSVFFSLTGTAVANSDYTPPANSDANSVSIIFRSGESVKDYVIVPLADNVVEGDETVILTLNQGNFGYAIDPDARSAEVTLADDPAVVSVIASDDFASEQGLDPAVFTFSRSGGDTSVPLMVLFSMTGTADRDADYTIMPTSASTIFIPAGERTAELTVMPLADANDEDVETIVVTLGGSEQNYLISDAAPDATVSLSERGRLIFSSHFEEVVDF